MTRNWVSAVILLVITLSMVNAAPFEVYKRDLFLLHKRAVTFGPCVPKASDIVLTVAKIETDPAPGGVAAATLSFPGPAAEAAKLFLTTTITEGDPKAPKAVDGGVTTSDLCESGLKCPVAKGKAITITAKTAIPKGVKAPFNIEYNINDGTTTIACAIGTVAGGKAPDDGKAPADGGKAPDDGGKAPDDGGKAPDDGGKAPDDGGKAPDDGGKAPADGPDDGGKAPGPDDGGKGPDDGGKAPGPDDGGKAPDDGGKAPE